MLKYLVIVTIVLSPFLLMADNLADSTKTYTFELELSGDTLLTYEKRELDPLVAGSTLKIIVKDISNFDEIQDIWKFTLNEEIDDKPDYDSAKSAAIYTFPIAANETKEQKLNFKDDSGKVALSEPNPMFVVKPKTIKSSADVLNINSTTVGGDKQIIKTEYKRSKNELILIFGTDGFLYGDQGKVYFPDEIDANDVIHIYVIGNKAIIDSLAFELEGKLTEDYANILSASSLANLSDLVGSIQATGQAKHPQYATVYVGRYGPFMAPSVTIKINKAGKQLRSYNLKVANTYIAALRFGIGKSDIVFNDFEVRTIKDSDSTHIKNTASKDGDIRPYLMVTFYAWQFWNKGFWKGRNINDNYSLANRINPFVGLGLKKIGHEYLVGISFEIARGLDILWGYHFAKIERLSGGYSEDDVFDGVKDDIPTETKWAESNQFWAVSIDVRIAVQTLKPLLGN